MNDDVEDCDIEYRAILRKKTPFVDDVRFLDGDSFGPFSYESAELSKNNGKTCNLLSYLFVDVL